MRFYGRPSYVEGAVTQTGKKPSMGLVSRLKRFYSFATSQAGTSNDSSIWSGIDQKRKPIHDALLSSDDSAFDLLSNPHETYLFYGMDNIYPDADLTNQDIGISECDTLERLAEALGTRRKFYDESLLFGATHKDLEIEKELDAVCLKLGIDDLAIPNPFKDTQGLNTSRGVLDYRSLQAMYQASRIMRFSPKRVVEIGGGLGRTASFSSLMGVEQYAIVDIPLTIVAQALFLGLTFGEEQIKLPGEIDSAQRFHLLLPDEFTEADYDVVFNADSMTEMRRQDASTYADAIKSNAKPFISINHEHNSFTVCDLFGPTFHRYPYWMRKGYVEEIFEFKSRQPQPLHLASRRLFASPPA
jgi:hypothetical protein